MAFAKVQGEVVGLANLQLAPNILEGVVFRARQADNVINDDPCICLITNRKATRCHELLPNAIDIIDKMMKVAGPLVGPNGIML